MKKTFTFLTSIVLFCLLAGWHNAPAQVPLDFAAYAGNPVLSHGSPGAYDATMCFLPFAIWHDETFYLFYTGDLGICLATSTDGYNFEKYFENPLLTTSTSGFDSYGISQTVIVETGSEWVMYYNGRENPGYGPGESVGRATAVNLTGPWVKMTDPVLTIGDPGEWDSGFIIPNAVFSLDTGGFIMFYSASTDFITGYWEIGMATSPDGITWTKYNDPATTLPPYAQSDPVLKIGDPGAWDEYYAWEFSVINRHGYYEMYYSGGGQTIWGIGYAWSYNGIDWQKWPENPVYIPDDDPYSATVGGGLEVPSLLIYNENVFMYYDYGPGPAEIGMATAPVWVGIHPPEPAGSGLQISCYPNPVRQSAVLSYTLDEPGQVKLEVFDSFGRLTGILINADQEKGEHRVSWNAGSYPLGIYYCRLQAGGKTAAGKIVVGK